MDYTVPKYILNLKDIEGEGGSKDIRLSGIGYDIFCPVERNSNPEHDDASVGGCSWTYPAVYRKYDNASPTFLKFLIKGKVVESGVCEGVRTTGGYTKQEYTNVGVASIAISFNAEGSGVVEEEIVLALATMKISGAAGIEVVLPPPVRG